MSLKAKIEAVIYAAEEPVTLSQLATIFAAEVPMSVPASVISEPEQIPLHEAAEGAPQLASETLIEPETGETTEAGLADEGIVGEAPIAATTAAATPSSREVRDYLRTMVEELISEYVVQDRGIEIREIAGGYRMATKPEYHDAVRAFVKSLKPPMKLSLQALETLAVIAYKQPVTAPEVAEIRGVDSGGVLAGLISRKLVTTAGRKQVIGRPILYKTTKEFLMRFGLKDVAELPSMEEFEKMAGELAENDAMEANAMQERAGVRPLPFEPEISDLTPEDAIQAPGAESGDDPHDEEASHSLEPVTEMQES